MKYLIICIFLSLAGLSCTEPAAAISFDQYHSQFEIASFLRETAVLNSDIAEFKKMGVTTEGREVAYLILGRKTLTHTQKIYLNGTHHGNEWSSTESALAVVDYMTRYKNTPRVAKLLNEFTFYVQPLVNPDGHAAGTRADSTGKDPNRDYPFPGSDGSNAFELRETRFVRNLMQEVNFKGAIAYHSGMEGVLYPWGHSPLPTQHQNKFRSLAQSVANAMRFGMFKQSWQDYPTRGEFTDYAYEAHGTFGITLEVSSAPMPSIRELNQVVARSIKGTMAFAESLSQNRNDANEVNSQQYFLQFPNPAFTLAKAF